MFSRDQLALLRGLADRYGDVVEMKVLGKTFWLLSHPDHVEAVLVKHARIMLRDEYISVLKRIVGEGLLTNFADQCPTCQGRGMVIDHALLE